MLTEMKMTALKNRIKKYGSGTYEFHLRNRNPEKDGRYAGGCVGHVRNAETGITVYVDTEMSCYAPLQDKVLVRFANGFDDYSGKGGNNQWPDRDTFYLHMVDMLDGVTR